MKTACFIPIKMNSERVPGKNLRVLNGKKLYEYARNGEEVEIPTREVEINYLEIMDIKDNLIKFLIDNVYALS